MKFSSVDAGDGWLIFALPPAELGIRPTDEANHHELFLMCDDIKATIKELKSRGSRVYTTNQERATGSVHIYKDSRWW